MFVDFSMADHLTWEDSYAIARLLMERHGAVALESVSLNEIYRWTIELPEFDDDLQLCNDAILMAIYREWYEEANA